MGAGLSAPSKPVLGLNRPSHLRPFTMGNGNVGGLNAISSQQYHTNSGYTALIPAVVIWESALPNLSVWPANHSFPRNSCQVLPALS